MPPQQPQQPQRQLTIQERAIQMLGSVSERMQHGQNPYNDSTQQSIAALLQDERTARLFVEYMEKSQRASEARLRRGLNPDQAAAAAAQESRFTLRGRPLTKALKEEKDALDALQANIRDRRAGSGVDAEEFDANRGAGVLFVRDIGLAYGMQEAQRQQDAMLRQKVTQLSEQYRSEVEAVRTASARGPAGRRDYDAAIERLRRRTQGDLQELSEHDRQEVLARMVSGTQQQQPGQQAAPQQTNGISAQVAAAARSAAGAVGDVTLSTLEAGAAQTVPGGGLVVRGARNLLAGGNRGNGGGGPAA